uniref:Uncharacterized protein n=1 Tax=Candidozyma auris TaxID=498019 RepID=A0A0L0NWF7_CANAR
METHSRNLHLQTSIGSSKPIYQLTGSKLLKTSQNFSKLLKTSQNFSKLPQKSSFHPVHPNNESTNKTTPKPAPPTIAAPLEELEAGPDLVASSVFAVAIIRDKLFEFDHGDLPVVVAETWKVLAASERADETEEGMFHTLAPTLLHKEYAKDVALATSSPRQALAIHRATTWDHGNHTHKQPVSQ